jgi:hypothetical protein
MDWLKDIVLPLLRTVIWGGVVVLLGRFLISKFEIGINRTLDRLRRAGPAEFEPATPAPQSESSGKLLPPPSSLTPVPPESLLGVFERSVRDSVATTSPNEREPALIRLAASHLLAWVFEILNSAILGSQIGLLLNINARPTPLAEVRTIYDQAAARYPDYYRSYTFDAWLNWFVEVAKFGARSDDHLIITEADREFAKYLVARGVTLARFG